MGKGNKSTMHHCPKRDGGEGNCRPNFRAPRSNISYCPTHKCYCEKCDMPPVFLKCHEGCPSCGWRHKDYGLYDKGQNKKVKPTAANTKDGNIKDGNVKDGNVKDGNVKDGNAKDGNSNDGKDKTKDGKGKEGNVTKESVKKENIKKA